MDDVSCLLGLFFLTCFFLCSHIFPPRRPYAGIFFLVSVLFCPCSSNLFTYVVVLAAFLIFLHHILQNSCRLFFVFFRPSFFSRFRPYAGIFFLVFVLLHPCSSYLFLFSMYVLAAFLIFLHHILQSSCRLFLSL